MMLEVTSAQLPKLPAGVGTPSPSPLNTGSAFNPFIGAGQGGGGRRINTELILSTTAWVFTNFFSLQRQKLSPLSSKEQEGRALDGAQIQHALFQELLIDRRSSVIKSPAFQHSSPREIKSIKYCQVGRYMHVPTPYKHIHIKYLGSKMKA